MVEPWVMLTKRMLVCTGCAKTWSKHVDVCPFQPSLCHSAQWPAGCHRWTEGPSDIFQHEDMSHFHHQA